MWILTVSTIIFIIAISFIIYSNWPKHCAQLNPKIDPCKKCGAPKNNCNCDCPYCQIIKIPIYSIKMDTLDKVDFDTIVPELITEMGKLKCDNINIY